MSFKNKTIIFWTTACLEPHIEAISKEVLDLSKGFKPSLIFAINPNIGLKFSLRHRYIGFNNKFYPILRIIVPFLESFGKTNHVYGNIAPWLFYKGLKRNPVIHTISSETGERNIEFLSKCKAIVVQSRQMKDELLTYGLDSKTIYCIYPAIDLTKFHFMKNYPPLDIPKILFATAPREARELEERGVYKLIEAAQIDSNIHYTLLFRKWGSRYSSFEKVASLLDKYQLHNVTLRNETINDMANEYQNHHYTIIPFAQKGGGKECPNSAIESIASGRPVLISCTSPFSEFIRNNNCGVVYDNSPEDIVQSIRNNIINYKKLQVKMNGLAQQFFDKKSIYLSYSNIYKTFG